MDRWLVAKVSRHEFTLSNGNKFYIRRYDAFNSLKILGDVQKRFLAPLVAVFEAVDSRKDAKNGEDHFVNAVEAMSQQLDGDALVDLARKVLNPEFVTVVIDNGEPQKLDEGSLNLATDGIFDIITLITEVLKHNYAELFTKGKTLIGKAQETMAMR